MSTFLELVIDLHTETGASGVAPATVLNQTGENARLVNWIVRADYKAQTKWINWKFLRSTWTTGNVTADTVATLAKPATLKTWDLATFKITYPGETDVYPLPAVEFEEIKTEILSTDTGIPSRVIIMPDDSLQFDPVPNGAYTITADFYLKPVKLAANTDVSLIPEEHHDDVILGRALMYYGNYENALEIKKQGEEMYAEGLVEMENHQLPNKNYSRNRTGGGFEVIGGQFAYDEY